MADMCHGILFVLILQSHINRTVRHNREHVEIPYGTGYLVAPTLQKGSAGQLHSCDHKSGQRNHNRTNQDQHHLDITLQQLIQLLTHTPQSSEKQIDAHQTGNGRPPSNAVAKASRTRSTSATKVRMKNWPEIVSRVGIPFMATRRLNIRKGVDRCSVPTYTGIPIIPHKVAIMAIHLEVETLYRQITKKKEGSSRQSGRPPGDSIRLGPKPKSIYAYYGLTYCSSQSYNLLKFTALYHSFPAQSTSFLGLELHFS